MKSRKMMKKWPTLSKYWTREPTIDIEVRFLWFFLIVMVLVILLTNVLIRKIRGMMNITEIENKHIKAKEPQRKFWRKSYAPKKTSHHQMGMMSVTVRHKELYSWKYKTLTKKTLKKNMKRQKLTIEKNCWVS